MKLKKHHRLPLLAIAALFGMAAAGVGTRLYQLQLLDRERYERRAEGQHFKNVTIQPERGDILDRTGRPLAQSTGRSTVYINPRYFREGQFAGDINALAAAVARLTEESEQQVLARFTGNATARIARRVRHERAEEIMRLLRAAGADSRGYWLHRESIRLYPSHVASAVIGFCTTDEDGDNLGIAGLELQYDQYLRGQKISGRAPRTGVRETLRAWNPEDLLEARGHSLVLTLDASLQEVAEHAIAAAVDQFQAASGGAVVLDPRDGAVLAMANYPTFDNNAFSRADNEARRNRTITDPFETGSVAKLFTAALLIDHGHITPDTLIDCQGGFAVVDGRRLQDSPGHYLRIATFREALRWSSNIGIVKAAQVLDNNTWYAYLASLRFGRRTGIDLPGEGTGILYPVERWTRFSRTSLPMGYEMSLTALQSAAAVAALVNGGVYYEPYLVREIRNSRGDIVAQFDQREGERVIRPTTSAVMRDLMEDIAENGTGTKARVLGYRVGGKTGTTRKSSIFDRREYISSFAGAVPIDAPRFVIYVYVDAPKTAYYASTVAAPAFRTIAEAAVLRFGITPSHEYFPAAAPQKVLEAVETTSGPSTTLPGEFDPSMVPDFRGLSMAQARERLPEAISRVRFAGRGIVTDQFPAPGTPLADATEIVLHFATPAEVPTR